MNEDEGRGRNRSEAADLRGQPDGAAVRVGEVHGAGSHGHAHDHGQGSGGHAHDHGQGSRVHAHDHGQGSRGHAHDHGQGSGGHAHDHGQPSDARAHGHDERHAHGHDNGHAHDHSHGIGHSHGAQPGERGFALGIALNLAFVVAEVVAGLAAGSMALLADAGHNLSDVLGLGMAWLAARLAGRPASRRHTYGLQRGTILAALANAVLLLVAVGAIALESFDRLISPAPVATGWMLWVALAGVAVNTGTAMLFMRGREADLNRRGAFLHLAADAAVSLGVVVGALVINATGWLWVDPVLGLVIAAVILVSGWGLLREATDLAMDAVPPGIDPRAVEAALAGSPGVAAVHDLHIWALGTTRTALTAHLERPAAAGPDDAFLAETAAMLQGRFGITHVTLQVGQGPPAAACVAVAR